MPAKKWMSVRIKAPQALRLFAKEIPLSQLYDSGYFVSEVFGTQAWVVNKNTFESQILQIVSEVPKKLSKQLREYNDKQYRRFLKLRHNDI